MVTEYVDCAELRRLIEDKKLKPATLKHYLRKNGIVFTASNAKEFAELYGMLSPNERQHVKSIIIGIQLAKEAEKEVALA